VRGLALTPLLSVGVALPATTIVAPTNIANRQENKIRWNLFIVTDLLEVVLGAPYL
jgi:hypothetical protein